MVASHGQKAHVRGVISDALTFEPLPGASIIYSGDQGTVSDHSGRYTLDVPPETTRLEFRYVGYQQRVYTLNLAAGDTVSLDVRLAREVRQMDQVVISAGRSEQRVAESTVSMSIIRPKGFETAHITDTRELINRTPGIEVVDGQASVRGGTGYSYGAGSRVLALVDGLPVLAADAGNIRWQFLPLENISQVEIIKGASSVLYGSSALNGVINFRTARATVEGRTSFYAESGVYDHPPNSNWKWWSSPRVFSSASFSHLKKYGHNELGVGVYGGRNPGYRKRNHEDVGRFSLQLRQNNKRHEGLSYGVNIMAGYNDKRDFVLWDNAETGALVQSETTAINLNSTFLAFDPYISLESDENFSHHLKTRLQRTDNSFHDAPNNDSEAISLLTEYQTWQNINDFINVNAGLFQKSSRIRSRFHGNHQSLNLAAYLQSDLSFSRRMKWVGGVRVELNSLNGVKDRFVPLFRTGINYMLSDYTFLRASWGQGYRYPSIAEKYAATTLGSVRIFPHPELESETGWSAELGLKQGLGAGIWEGMIDVAGFYTQNKNMIEYLFGLHTDPETGELTFGFRADNTEHSRVYGGEIDVILEAHVGLVEHTITGGYVYMHPVEFDPQTRKNTGEYLKYRRKHAAQAGYHARLGAWQPGVDLYYKSATLSIDHVFVSELTREQILPGFYDYWQNNNTGYLLVNFSLAYYISHKYKISLVVKNVTNQEYMGRPGDIQPHRNFSIRLSGKI